MSAGVVISGPQGTGKTLHAEALRRHYGMKHVIDDGSFAAGDRIPDDTLVLTCEEDPRAIPIATALRAIRQPDPSARRAV